MKLENIMGIKKYMKKCECVLDIVYQYVCVFCVCFCFLSLCLCVFFFFFNENIKQNVPGERNIIVVLKSKL